MTADAFDDLTENIGGENNAFTADDVTVYHEVVPSNYLEPILWAEAERMSALALNEKNFTSERDVVKEEYRQRILANPYGEFYLDIDRKSFAVHPYKRPGIGSIPELDASKLPEVRAFHSTFYRPDNATLIVVGDFKQEELDGWIKKYFGAISKPSRRFRVSRSRSRRGRRISWKCRTARRLRCRRSLSRISLHRCAARTRRLFPWRRKFWRVATSSRLYQSLVYEQQIAQAVSCSADLHEDLGLLVFRLVLASGKSVEVAKKSLTDQIEKVLKNGVTEAELAKAKNRLLAFQIAGSRDGQREGEALWAKPRSLYGDAARVNTDLAMMQAVTTAQIKDVLNKYITGKKKVVIEYLPESMKVCQQSEKQEEVVMKTRTICSLRSCVFAPLHFAAAIGGIDTAPPPSAPHEMTFVQTQRSQTGERSARHCGRAAWAAIIGCGTARAHRCGGRSRRAGGRCEHDRFPPDERHGENDRAADRERD